SKGHVTDSLQLQAPPVVLSTKVPQVISAHAVLRLGIANQEAGTEEDGPQSKGHVTDSLQLQAPPVVLSIKVPQVINAHAVLRLGIANQEAGTEEDGPQAGTAGVQGGGSSLGAALPGSKFKHLAARYLHPFYLDPGLVRQQLKLQQREVPRELGGRGVGGVSQDGQDAHGWDPELLKAEVQQELAQATIDLLIDPGSVSFFCTLINFMHQDVKALASAIAKGCRDDEGVVGPEEVAALQRARLFVMQQFFSRLFSQQRTRRAGMFFRLPIFLVAARLSVHLLFSGLFGLAIAKGCRDDEGVVGPEEVAALQRARLFVMQQFFSRLFSQQRTRRAGMFFRLPIFLVAARLSVHLLFSGLFGLWTQTAEGMNALEQPEPSGQ
ncbi:uncharacterized protein HaLaN_11329, partial [Haematococcus lacustris]